jgi:AcrR family transcriptional regulator
MKESSVKEKIVEVATRLFYQQGYNLTSINQVIEEADIARGSLYNHFNSKTEVLLSYVDEFQKRWFVALDAFLRPVTDPKKKILALFDFRVQNQQRMGYGGCPLVKVNDEISREDVAVNRMVRDYKDKLKDYISVLVQQSGHKQLLTDEALTELIYLMMEGALTSAAIYKDTKHLKSAKKIIQGLI